MGKHLFLTEKRKIPVGDHSIRLLILRPLEKSEKPVPGVLWVHGGGYQSGSAKDIFVTRALSLVVKFGAVLVAPDYRLSKRHPYPAALHDCWAALLYLKEHAGELGVRPDQIMVGGESAGGGMAAALCMLARDRGEVNIAFQMPLYPMLDDRDTPSSKDNHAPNWNSRRNRKAWKRYLREAWGTDLVSCYAAPARCKDYHGLPPCYTFVGDIELMYAICRRRGCAPRSMSIRTGFTPMTSFSRPKRSYARPLRALRRRCSTLSNMILPRSAGETAPDARREGCRSSREAGSRLLFS